MKTKTKAKLARDLKRGWAHLRAARRLLEQAARQALADEKTDGLDRSEYRRRLRAEAAKLKGESLHGKSQTKN